MYMYAPAIRSPVFNLHSPACIPHTAWKNFLPSKPTRTELNFFFKVEQTFGAKPLRSISPHLLNEYRECLEACMEEADLEEYFSRGIGVRGHMTYRDAGCPWWGYFHCSGCVRAHHNGGGGG